MLLLGSDLFATLVYNELKKRKFDINFMCKYCKQPYSDINIVASYGVKLPQSIVKTGIWLNVHPSLLPQYRGPTPIEHSLLYGNRMGISLITLADKLDTGELFAQTEIPFKLMPYYDSIIYHAEHAVELLSAVLPNIHKIKTIPQCGEISHSTKLSPDLAMVDFLRMSNFDILKRFYAISYRYRLRTKWKSHLMFLDKLELCAVPLAPGEFILHNDHMDVGCKTGSIRVSQVSRLTGNRCDPLSFFNGLRYKSHNGTFIRQSEELKLQ